MVLGRYDPIIAEASRKYGVPEATIRAVMGVESSGNPAARSPKGAAGLMQIMPDTYTDLARRHSLGPDRYDPRNNIFAGTAYLGEMHSQFGNWDEAVQAYNMGPGRAMRVRNGTATVPPETRDYLPKVQAALGQTPTREVATVPVPRSVDEGANMPSFSFAAPQQQRVGSLSGLLEADDDKNFYEGLGGIWNTGQTPSQPPRTDPAAMSGTTQTDRMDIGDFFNRLLQPGGEQPPGPSISPSDQAPLGRLQYQLAGAGSAVGQLAGITNRRVGIGELLGALGGGLTQGAAAGMQAQRQQRADQRAETGEKFDNVYKAAMARKALMPEPRDVKTVSTAEGVFTLNRDGSLGQRLGSPTGGHNDGPKVVGSYIYENGQFKAPPGGAAGEGPFAGNSAEVQGVNEMIRQGRITVQQGAEWLASKGVAGINGGYDFVSPLALPGAGAPPAGQTPAAAPPAPGGALIDPPPPAVAPPAAVPPAKVAGVTNVRPGVATPNNEQSLAAGFANRLYAANTELDTLENAGFVTPGLVDRGLDKVPLLGNYLTSEQFQQSEQAQREFINAQLRRESGAAVSESEFENARRQYFPQPGDSPEVLAQKRRSRNMAIANMAQAAGPAKMGFDPPKVTMPPEEKLPGGIPAPPPGFVVR